MRRKMPITNVSLYTDPVLLKREAREAVVWQPRGSCEEILRCAIMIYPNPTSWPCGFERSQSMGLKFVFLILNDHFHCNITNNTESLHSSGMHFTQVHYYVPVSIKNLNQEIVAFGGVGNSRICLGFRYSFSAFSSALEVVRHVPNQMRRIKLLQ